MDHCLPAPNPWLERPAVDRAAWNAFRTAAGAVLAEVDAELQQHLKVGYSDVDALLQLSTAEGGCLRMGNLARSISRSPSALTRLVDRLEGRGLVERQRLSPTDVRVEVTNAGLDLLADAAPRILDRVEDRFWSRLTDTERATLAALCTKLLDENATHC